MFVAENFSGTTDISRRESEGAHQALQTLARDIEETLPTGIEVVYQAPSADAPEIRVIKLSWEESDEVYKHAYAKREVQSIPPVVQTAIPSRTIRIPGLDEEATIQECLDFREAIKSFQKRELPRLEGYMKSEEFQLVQLLFFVRRLLEKTHWISPARIFLKCSIKIIEIRLFQLHPECSEIGEILTIYNAKGLERVCAEIRSYIKEAVNGNLNEEHL